MALSRYKMALHEQGAGISRRFKELIVAYVWGGVETERRLRNVWEFAEALEAALVYQALGLL